MSNSKDAMKQNLVNITKNLTNIYDKIKSIESSLKNETNYKLDLIQEENYQQNKIFQDEIMAKLDTIISNQLSIERETNKKLEKRINDINEKMEMYQTYIEGLIQDDVQIIELLENMNTDLEKLKGNNETIDENLSSGMKTLSSNIISFQDNLDQIQTKINERTLNNQIKRYVDSSKKEYITILQCEMEIFRNKILKCFDNNNSSFPVWSFESTYL